MNSSVLNPSQQELISAAYDPALVQQIGQRLIELLGKHLERVQSGEGAVLNWQEPSENIQQASERLSSANFSSSSTFAELQEKFTNLARETLDRGQNLHHPHYVGHQVPASVPLAGLFDALTTVTNQVMAIYEMGPWATAVERAVVNKLGEAMGFAAGKFSGLVTSGGSLANLTALLTARNVALKESWSKGLANTEILPVLVTHAEAHYCVTRSAGILGLGTDQIIRVPLDCKRRMDVTELDRILSDLRSRGVPIVAVSAAACATPIGAFDPLVDISEVCRKHSVWMHVDAAHGGAACLSTKHQHLVEGLELADSVVCDAHKMLFMPALCAFVFYRNHDHRYQAFRQTAPYLFDPSAPGMAEYDNGITNIECTKRAMAMGLWGVWSMFGKELFEALIDSTFALGQEFYQLLDEQVDFEPYCQPECNIVVFQFMPEEIKSWSEEKVDDFQLRLRRNIIESGEFYLVQTRIDGRSYLRVTIINPQTTLSDLKQLLDCLRKNGKQLI